jgi:hypothetical protein
MKTAPSPVQGETLCQQLLNIADELDNISQNQVFLTTLREIARLDLSLMDEDLNFLLATYLDTEPREKLREASDKLATLARTAKNLLDNSEN